MLEMVNLQGAIVSQTKEVLLTEFILPGLFN